MMASASHPRQKPAQPRRHQRDLVRICGLAAVAALFERDPGRAERLFYEPRLRAAAAPFCRRLAAQHKPYREVDGATLARIAGTLTHGGIAAIARPRRLPTFDPAAAALWAGDGKPILVLDGIGNPHNLGAIARSAAFFGIERIVLAERPEQALPSDASYRVAEGGLEYVSLYRAVMPQAAIALGKSYHLVAAVPEGGGPLGPRRHKPFALVLGNEQSGIDPAILAQCRARVTIPGTGRMQSLNVAAAAAILTYLLMGG